MRALVWIILAHLLVELVLTTAAMQNRLREGAPSAYLRHGLQLFFGMMGALWLQTDRPWTSLLVGAVALVLGHLVIDRLGGWLEGAEALRALLQQTFAGIDQGLYRLVIWVAWQALHLAMLWFLTGLLFPPHYPLDQITWYVTHHLWGSVPLLPQDRLAYPLLLLVLGSFGGAQVVRLAIQSLGPPEEIRKVTTTQTVVEQRTERDATQVAGETRVITRQIEPIAKPVGAPLAVGELPQARSEATEERSQEQQRSRVVRSELREETESPTDLQEGTGRWIGILERLLVMTLVAFNAWQAIGFVFAAKSVARYRQLEHRAFVEYYIVGTLLSLIIGILFGLLLGRALGSLGMG